MIGERWNCCPKCGHDVERCVAGAARLDARIRALEAEVEALRAIVSDLLDLPFEREPGVGERLSAIRKKIVALARKGA